MHCLLCYLFFLWLCWCKIRLMDKLFNMDIFRVSTCFLAVKMKRTNWSSLKRCLILVQKVSLEKCINIHDTSWSTRLALALWSHTQSPLLSFDAFSSRDSLAKTQQISNSKTQRKKYDTYLLQITAIHLLSL